MPFETFNKINTWIISIAVVVLVLSTTNLGSTAADTAVSLVRKTTNAALSFFSSDIKKDDSIKIVSTYPEGVTIGDCENTYFYSPVADVQISDSRLEITFSQPLDFPDTITNPLDKFIDVYVSPADRVDSLISLSSWGSERTPFGAGAEKYFGAYFLKDKKSNDEDTRTIIIRLVPGPSVCSGRTCPSISGNPFTLTKAEHYYVLITFDSDFIMDSLNERFDHNSQCIMFEVI